MRGHVEAAAERIKSNGEFRDSVSHSTACRKVDGLQTFKL